MESTVSDQPKKAPQVRSRRVKPVNLDHLELQFLTVLKREAGRLMDLSFAKKLSPTSSRTLVNYLNLLKDLKQREAADLENLTDDELEKMATKENKNG